MRCSSLALVLTASTPALLPAQSPSSIVQADFNTPNYDPLTSMGGPNLLVAIQLTASSTYTATRLEVFTGNQHGTNSLAIWSDDAVNNRPLALLAQGTWTMSSIRGWQGANLSAAVPLTSGQTFWFVWGPINGAQASSEGTGAGAQPYRASFDGGLNWGALYQSRQWKLRIWTGTAGHYESFGTGCAGSTRAIPELGWDGVPTVLGGGNTILLEHAPANDFALMTIGESNTTFAGNPLPLDLGSLGASGCQLLTSVAASLFVLTDGSGQASQAVTVPVNGALLGFQYFDQWFVHDAAANPLQFKVSNGGVGTIGL